MNPLLRVSVVAALALVSLDGRAAVRRPCVTTLEAQRGASPDAATQPPKKPCPVAVAYAPVARTAAGRRDALRRGPAALAASTTSRVRA